MKVTTIGIDLAKDVFGLHGVDGEGRVTFKRRLVRSRLLEFLSQLPRCLVGLEACSSAHYWAREIERLGHRVRLMSPRFVKPYRKSDKNDANDAEAICEAVTRASMRFVSDQERSSASRFRRCTGYVEQLLKSRTALTSIRCGACSRSTASLPPHGIAHARAGCCWGFSPIPEGVMVSVVYFRETSARNGRAAALLRRTGRCLR